MLAKPDRANTISPPFYKLNHPIIIDYDYAQDYDE